MTFPTVLTPDEVEQAMRAYFPPVSAAAAPENRKRLTAKDFEHIGKLLERLGQREWSLRPRTYAVLRLINCTEAMNIFVTLGLYDIAFPYSERTLPEAIKSHTVRSNFLQAQSLVTTKATTLESSDGGHRHFADDGELAFKRERILGRGGSGVVDLVYSRLSCKAYARKLIPRGKTFKKDQQKLLDFEKELATLKRLSHHHLVELVGSYTDKKFVALIMSPVAEYNLKEYLFLEPFDEFRRRNLRTFFGCLSAALLFLHENKIRHKDIKPQNILVKDDEVLLTDFGTALDWTDLDHSTTQNTRTGWTPGYCAPEVVNYEPRNSSADIWSLACVFCEMASVLKKQTLHAMKAFFQSHGTGGEYIRINPEAARLWLEQLRQSPGPSHDNEPLEWIRKMMQGVPRERIGTAELANEIMEFDSEEPFIGACCLEEDDSECSSCSSYYGSDADVNSDKLSTNPSSQDTRSIEANDPIGLEQEDPIKNIPKRVQSSLAPNVSDRRSGKISQSSESATLVATPPETHSSVQSAPAEPVKVVQPVKSVNNSVTVFPPLGASQPKASRPPKNRDSNKSYANIHGKEPEIQQPSAPKVKRDSRLDALIVYGTELDDNPKYICDWPGCPLATRDGHFYKSFEIRKHYKQKHSDYGGYQCPHGGCIKSGKMQFFRDLESFLTHYQNHSQTTQATQAIHCLLPECPKPDVAFSTLTMLRQHQSSDHVSKLLRRSLHIIPDDQPLTHAKSSETLHVPPPPVHRRSISAPAPTTENDSLEGSIVLPEVDVPIKYGKYSCSWPGCFTTLSDQKQQFNTDLELHDHFKTCHVDYWLPEHPAGKGYQCPYYQCIKRGELAFDVSDQATLVAHFHQHEYAEDGLNCQLPACRAKSHVFPNAKQLREHLTIAHREKSVATSKVAVSKKTRIPAAK